MCHFKETPRINSKNRKQNVYVVGTWKRAEVDWSWHFKLCDIQKSQALDPCLHPYKHMQVCARFTPVFYNCWNSFSWNWSYRQHSDVVVCYVCSWVRAGCEKAIQEMQMKLLFYCCEISNHRSEKIFSYADTPLIYKPLLSAHLHRYL